MRLLHTSDWQIGKMFRMVDDSSLALLQAERLEAIGRIGRLAQQHGAAAVLVAGDVYDVTGVSLTTLLQPVERMRQFREIEWHLIPGNHDAHGAGGPWERLLKHPLPENLHLHTTPEPCALAGGAAWLLPAVLTQRHGTGDPTAWMDAAETPLGRPRVGLAHGSNRVFGSSEASTHNVIAGDRAERANLAYLALGDWHGAVRAGARTWYSGTPEPDGFDLGGDGGGGVLLVDLPEDAAAGAEPTVTRLPSARYGWRAEAAVLHAREDVTVLETRLRALDADLSHVLLRLRVSGALDLPSRELYEERIRTGLGSAFRSLILDDAALLVQPTAADLESIDHMGFVGEVAKKLAATARDPSASDQALAAHALQHLYLMHAQGNTGPQRGAR